MDGRNDLSSQMAKTLNAPVSGPVGHAQDAPCFGPDTGCDSVIYNKNHV